MDPNVTVMARLAQKPVGRTSRFVSRFSNRLVAAGVSAVAKPARMPGPRGHPSVGARPTSPLWPRPSVDDFKGYGRQTCQRQAASGRPRYPPEG